MAAASRTAPPAGAATALRFAASVFVVLPTPPVPIGGAQHRAAEPQVAAPERLGSFDAWTAAAYGKAGQKVCYALARAAPDGANRQRATLTVAHWAQDRNQVSLSAGFAFPPGAAVEVAVGRTKLPFVAQEDTAHARDGLAAVLAFRRGGEAVARRPSRRGGTAADTFPLSGFGPAYDAITRACTP